MAATLKAKSNSPKWGFDEQGWPVAKSSCLNREVLRQRYLPNKPIDVSGLARASYVVRLADPNSGDMVVGRFIRL